jgi:alpha-glucosidase
VRGGAILPMRVSGANTTTTLRTKDFMLLVPVGTDGTAAGELYLDEGDSILQPSISHLTFNYQHGRLKMDGQFGHDPKVKLRNIMVLQSGMAVKNVTVDAPLTAPLTVDLRSQAHPTSTWLA